MFRRKQEIPQEPVIPTPEQILEDVLNSPDDDCVFRLSDTDADPADEKVQAANANSTFEKVRAFVELHEHMKQCLTEMKQRNESLKISDCKLKAMANDIRKQSIEALK